ncbi:hypothetical protein [Thalassoglobus sp.]|uniref:hypothetical protein n=1 Tax=Thalassoglobus sp. TaxID=2795869 RepID=UPI003AA8CDCB
MSKLTVQQRKLLYAGVALLALIPVLFLGPPSTPAVLKEDGTRNEGSRGGTLAQLRTEYELGESSLGDVDPTSASWNLVLLGMRGVAASWLWQKADHYRTTKNFNQLAETVESIILLQPHFKAVWEYQAWNLTYNVSAECDDVKDRYHWVKRGAKFMIRGTERNKKVPELQFSTGQFFGTKIGVADEKEVYRQFFLSDPNVEIWGGGPDETINPKGIDNYLVAREWYLKANDTLELPNVEQHRMDQALFVAYPYRCLMEYARFHQQDGVADQLDEIETLNLEPEEELARRENVYKQWANESQKNWSDAYREWTDIYGRKRIESSGGGTIILEYDNNVLEQLAEEDKMTLADKQKWQNMYRKTTSYDKWKRHCEIERRDEMTRARYHLTEGRRLYRNVQDFEGAKKYLEEGMALLDSVIQQYVAEDGSNVMLVDEPDTVEDSIKAILMWQAVLELLGEPVPEDFPLKQVWENPEYQALREDLTDRFLLWQGG